ncbi:unnamed protein product [Lactuca saligna]|uniref:AAA+ ATPase domain-containing protein n=2 Tax=Magnoliopsida TaxID=3398 RepID=A0AA36A5R9_LACSI|nr:unnamed protein product [Lactuca saligna]
MAEIAGIHKQQMKRKPSNEVVKEKWAKHYSSNHQILLVGEGDFSFSVSLAMAFGSASNIVASSIDSYDYLIKNYKNAKANLDILREFGAQLLHVVNAVKMKNHTDLRKQKFDRIVYNFPHSGDRGKESDEDIIVTFKFMVSSNAKKSPPEFPFQKRLKKTLEEMNPIAEYLIDADGLTYLTECLIPDLFYLETSSSDVVRGVRESLRSTKKDYAKTEDDLKSLQSVGQIIGEVLRPLDNERLIVKASSGPRYVVGCRSKVDKEKLTAGTRVVLDMTTLTIMRALPREVDPVVYNMLHEDPGNISYSAVGGLSDQIRELRESIELPLMNPELFIRVGIKPPKGVLLYGPPGTGKTLLARAIASNIDANFLKVVSSAIIDKYIGESARLIREMFNYARDHQPCIIFMDEIDAIGGRRFSEGTSADREIQRTLMELLNQLDGFDQLGKVKMIMATNRPDVLDPALLRPGRLDRKIEIPLPNEQSRMEILKIHAAGIAKHGEIDYEAVVKLAEGFNGADLRNVCTEAGMSAIRAERDYVIHEDFMKAVRKLNEAKKLESSAHYNADFGKD